MKDLKLRRTLEGALTGFLRGLKAVAGPAEPGVDQTPRDQVLGVGKLRLLRFRPQSGNLAPVPILLVPPLMVRPYIFDLHPARSLAHFLVSNGYDLYLVDFGVPDQHDLDLHLDAYVLDFLPRAVEGIRLTCGASRVTLIGYCVGGLFALLYAASAGRERVQNLILLGVPVDYHRMGMLSLVCQRAQKQIDFLIDRVGNMPGLIPALGMQVANPINALARYADLFTNAFNEEFVQSYHSLSHWANDFIPSPREAYRDFFDQYVVGNNLLTGQAQVGGQRVDLKQVTCPVLSMSGSRDPVANAESATAILRVVGSQDKTFVEVPGGHIGLVAGGRAPRTSWKEMLDWLGPRSQAPQTSF